MLPLRDDNPSLIKPILTVTLIAINVLVFLYQASLAPRAGRLFVFQFGAVPSVVFGPDRLPAGVMVIPPVFTLLTSMFLHGGWMHLIGNMWYLWIFGNNIEEAMGRARFLLFYILSGLVASICHVYFNLGSHVPIIGASGAISGVLGAYLILYPRAQVLVLIWLGIFSRLVYIPAMFVLGFWFLLQVFSGAFSGGEGAGVAWWAHIGGFIAGAVMVGVFKRPEVRFFNPPRGRIETSFEW
jgi:membrane associated rhomboid family serine protease